MFSILAGVIYANVLLFMTAAWIAGSKASKLLYGGSPERMQRKARKLMVWIAYATLPAFSLIVATSLMPRSMNPVFREDRALLYVSLTAIPLLAIWLLTMPRLFKLWQAARRLNRVPLPAKLRQQAAQPLVVLPFRSAALAAAAILYLMLETPVTLHWPKAFGLLAVWVAATVSFWLFHDRRGQRALS
ncbi:hypothetical protein D7Z26_23950 [Cohnella endophytica]|uniref:Uncharacterized protein n=1 Tax=Cohnella endophytica TaxID=2419778 RepID=A0A494XBG2_9BACL|nr:hypothetical protein [Cohnella endophytica]RKP47352.1 hypothetical protein D7Z26_23950 [Cohnella endophytica]